MKKALSKVQNEEKTVQISVPDLSPINLDLIKSSMKQVVETLNKQAPMLDNMFKQQMPMLQEIVKRANEDFKKYHVMMENLGVADRLIEIEKERIRMEKFVINFIEQSKIFYVSRTEHLIVPSRTHEKHYDDKINLDDQTIKKIADILFEKLEEKKENSISKENLHSRNRLTFPDEKHWDALRLEFVNEFDVEIYSGKTFIKKVSHEDIGFVKKNTKDKKYDRSWDFLYKLSAFQGRENECAPNTKEMSRVLSVSDSTLHKIKSNLCMSLKEIFPNIEGEPFFNYEEYRYYKTRFKLEPMPLLRGDGNARLLASGYSEEPPGDQEYY